MLGGMVSLSAQTPRFSSGEQSRGGPDGPASGVIGIDSMRNDLLARTLLGQMTQDEKIGQMVQADLACLHDPADVQKYALGSVFSGGGSKPAENSPQGWLKSCNELQSLGAENPAEDSRCFMALTPSTAIMTWRAR